MQPGFHLNPPAKLMISSAQGRPMEDQQNTGIISYSEPNFVPPSHPMQQTDQKCLPIDSGSEKQTMDRKEIDAALIHATQDKIK